MLSSRMFAVHFFSLSTISWIAFSAPLGSAGLIFSYCMLLWPLPLVASLPCSILDPDFVSEFYAEQNVWYPKKQCPWNVSTFSAQLPLFAHVGNLSGRKFCSPNTFVLWYTGTSRFSWVTKPVSTHSTSNNTSQWSLIPFTVPQDMSAHSGRTR